MGSNFNKNIIDLTAEINFIVEYFISNVTYFSRYSTASSDKNKDVIAI
jgi:hypothetical protein